MQLNSAAMLERFAEFDSAIRAFDEVAAGVGSSTAGPGEGNNSAEAEDLKIAAETGLERCCGVH